MKNLADVSFLVIDNDPQTRQILEMLLRHVLKSNKIIIYEGSDHLDEKLARLPFVPDVVILDVVMRPLNGYDVVQNLQQNKLFRASKLIAVTAKVMPDDIQKIQQAGFHGLISKPIIRQVFPRLIQRILNGEAVWYIA